MYCAKNGLESGVDVKETGKNSIDIKSIATLTKNTFFSYSDTVYHNNY